MSSKIKVLYLITELDIGGAQQALYHLLSLINDHQFEVVVVCFYNGNKVVAQKIRKLGVPVYELGMAAKWRVDALARFYQLLKKERPMILHTWLFHANFSGRLIGRLATVPVIVCSERTMAMESEFRYRLNRWTIGLVDIVTANSVNVCDFCADHIGIPKNKLEVIYNGVCSSSQNSKLEARELLGVSATETVIGCVSRLDPVKGVAYLVEAMSYLKGVKLIVIGDGPERKTLETLINQFALEKQIILVGNRTDVPKLLPAFDVFVQPSLHEGMPNTVLEAMAAKLPIVATAVGGTPELVIPTQTGLLVPPKNAYQLAMSIKQIMASPNLAQMGQAGWQRVQQEFTFERMVKQHEVLYQQLVKRKV